MFSKLKTGNMKCFINIAVSGIISFVKKPKLYGKAEVVSSGYQGFLSAFIFKRNY